MSNPVITDRPSTGRALVVGKLEIGVVLAGFFHRQQNRVGFHTLFPYLSG